MQANQIKVNSRLDGDPLDVSQTACGIQFTEKLGAFTKMVSPMHLAVEQWAGKVDNGGRRVVEFVSVGR